jgi:hypothetical protein
MLTTHTPHPTPRRTPTGHARIGVLAVTTLAAALMSACSSAPQQPKTGGLLLSGPDTNIVVTIPTGWHQLINTANPLIPEMVTPTDCMGSNETACATALARIATITAPDATAAEKAVEQAITTAPGVTKGTSLSEGPGKIGKRDGYRHRFTFSNPGAHLTADIAAVPSGPTTPDAQNNHEYSVVLVWVSDKPNAPQPDTIDHIIDSTLVAGGTPATS